MDIYLIQHGQALSEEQDSQRPLSNEGRSQTMKMAEFLAARSVSLIGPAITEIRHSGKLRARQTADILAQSLCPSITPTVGQGMNPKDNPRLVYEELAAGRDRPGVIMLVGHLPHLERLAGLLLTGDPERVPIQFVNSGVLKACPLPTGWAIGWYLTPACAC